MVIYPIPAAVTQAKVQLVVDEMAKAPSQTINADVQNVVATQTQAEREALLAARPELRRPARSSDRCVADVSRSRGVVTSRTEFTSP